MIRFPDLWDPSRFAITAATGKIGALGVAASRSVFTFAKKRFVVRTLRIAVSVYGTSFVTLLPFPAAHRQRMM